MFVLTFPWVQEILASLKKMPAKELKKPCSSVQGNFPTRSGPDSALV